MSMSMSTKKTLSARPRRNLRTLGYRTAAWAAAILGLAVASPAAPTSTNMILTKLATPEPVAIGNPITYTLGVVSHGPDDGENVSLTDTLPATVTFVSASGTDWTCSHLAGTVTCD